MKLECELRDREHLLIDMRNKLATLEAQMEYVSYIIVKVIHYRILLNNRVYCTRF